MRDVHSQRIYTTLYGSDEEAIDLSCACGFSYSLIAQWLDSNGPQSPTTLCQKGLPLTLLPAEGLCLPCRLGSMQIWNLSPSYQSGWWIIWTVYGQTLVHALWFEIKLQGRIRQHRDGRILDISLLTMLLLIFRQLASHTPGYK